MSENNTEYRKIYEIPKSVINPIFSGWIFTESHDVVAEDDESKIIGTAFYFRNNEIEDIADHRTLYIHFDGKIYISGD